jgi:hypothetical protein
MRTVYYMVACVGVLVGCEAEGPPLVIEDPDTDVEDTDTDVEDTGTDVDTGDPDTDVPVDTDVPYECGDRGTLDLQTWTTTVTPSNNPVAIPFMGSGDVCAVEAVRLEGENGEDCWVSTREDCGDEVDLAAPVGEGVYLCVGVDAEILTKSMFACNVVMSDWDDWQSVWVRVGDED